MTEAGKNGPTEENLAPLIAQAQALLETLQEVRVRADEQLAAAELARKKADSEALYAFNAKGACEGHSTAVAALKGAAEADANSVATNKQHSDELLASINAAKAGSDADVGKIAERRKEVDQSAGELASAVAASLARVKEIDASKESAVAGTNAVSEALRAAKEATEATGDARKQAEKSAQEASALTVAISENHKAAKENSEQTAALLLQARNSEADLKKVLDHLSRSDEIAVGYEARVEKLATQLQALIERTENLLPGATSAGLASAFNKQRQRFLTPQRQWLITFVCCIAGLVIVALPSFFSALSLGWWGHSQVETWDVTWRVLTMRLPIVLPLVWLGIYAGRNYMISLRLEEDYAYKEAVSSSFEGYKREMEKIAAGTEANPTPITILCTNVLRAIAERPGRIYEGKQEDINLLNETKSAFEKSAEFSKKKLSGN